MSLRLACDTNVPPAVEPSAHVARPSHRCCSTPAPPRRRGRKRWILSVPVRGAVWLDEGARVAVQDRKKSLFSAGIVYTRGDFQAQARSRDADSWWHLRLPPVHIHPPAGCLLAVGARGASGEPQPALPLTPPALHPPEPLRPSSPRPPLPPPPPPPLRRTL